MTDIHCHLLFGVDDGPETMEESARMLRYAKEQGIRRIIATSHYRHGMFSHSKERIEASLNQLLPVAKSLGIELGVGTEYHVNSSVVAAMEQGKCFTLAGSRYVLCEYSHNTDYDTIYRMSGELLAHGYVPVIAHVERYLCMTKEVYRAEELRELGGWIQVNADAVLGYEGWGIKKYCKKMISRELVDVIASDSHDVKKRCCHLKECKMYVSRRFGDDTAERLLVHNPEKIWKNLL